MQLSFEAPPTFEVLDGQSQRAQFLGVREPHAAHQQMLLCLAALVRVNGEYREIRLLRCRLLLLFIAQLAPTTLHVRASLKKAVRVLDLRPCALQRSQAGQLKHVLRFNRSTVVQVRFEALPVLELQRNIGVTRGWEVV